MTCPRPTLMPCFLYSLYVKKTLLRNIRKALWFLVSSLTRFWRFDSSLVPYSTPSCTLERGNFRLEFPLVNHFLEKQAKAEITLVKRLCNNVAKCRPLGTTYRSARRGGSCHNCERQSTGASSNVRIFGAIAKRHKQDVFFCINIFLYKSNVHLSYD